MKQISLLLLTFCLCSGLMQAQPAVFQSFIDQHKQDQGFTYAFLSKDLFEVATQSSVKSEDWKALHQVVKNIGSLVILSGEKLSNGVSLYKEAKAMLPEDAFDALLTVRDGKENVRIWSKSEENVVTDLVLMLGAPDQFVLICFAGNPELGNLAELVSLFESGKAGELARTSAAVAADFELSPNPSNGQFALRFSDEQDFPTLLRVLDANGRQLHSISLSGTGVQSVNLQELSPGNYWLQLTTQKGRIGIKQIHIQR